MSESTIPNPSSGDLVIAETAFNNMICRACINSGVSQNNIDPKFLEELKKICVASTAGRIAENRWLDNMLWNKKT